MEGTVMDGALVASTTPSSCLVRERRILKGAVWRVHKPAL